MTTDALSEMITFMLEKLQQVAQKEGTSPVVKLPATDYNREWVYRDGELECEWYYSGKNC